MIHRVIIILLGIFLITSLSRSIVEYRRNQSFYEEYKEEYEKEKKRHLQLQTDFVKTQDPFELEKNIRDRLNLHKKDEHIIIIPNISPTTITPTPTPLKPYEQWGRLFFAN